MKVFDVHIGVSDSVIVTGKNPFTKGLSIGKYPSQFDIVRAKEGGLEIFCGMMCPVVLEKDKLVLPKNLKEEIDKHISIYEDLEKKEKAIIIRKKEDFGKKGLKILLGLEGVYFIKIKKDLEFLEQIIKRGVKIIGPMWNFKSNLFTEKKISQLGKKFLEVCERNNIIIDLAHSENAEFYTILNNYNGFIIDSHTNVFSLKKNKRNIKRKQIKAIIERNGIIGLTFVGEFVGGKTIAKTHNHFSNFIKEYGNRNIVIGSDFDGMGKEDIVKGLEDVSKYQNFVNFMRTKSIDDKSIKRIIFKNSFDYYKFTF